MLCAGRSAFTTLLALALVLETAYATNNTGNGLSVSRFMSAENQVARGSCTYTFAAGGSVDLAELFTDYEQPCPNLSTGLTTDKCVKGGGYYYMFNLCQPIGIFWYGSGTISCGQGNTMTCQFERPSSSFNYAVARPPRPTTATPEANGFYIDLVGGDPKNCAQSRKARYHMVCAETEALPTFIGETSTCSYEFEWKTPLACTSPCHITSASNGAEIDLRPLAGSVYSAPNTQVPGMTEHIVLCDASAYVRSCGEGAAVCETNTAGTVATTISTYPITLSYDPMVTDPKRRLWMTFSKAAGSSSAASVIYFICNHYAGAGNPVFLTESSGKMEFEWASKHACPVGETPPPTLPPTLAPTAKPTTTAEPVERSDGPAVSAGAIVGIVAGVVVVVVFVVIVIAVYMKRRQLKAPFSAAPALDGTQAPYTALNDADDSTAVPSYTPTTSQP